MIDRRRLLAAVPGAALIAGVVASPATAEVPPIGPGDMTVGSARARVQMIEYASLSCPHCARWHADVWPEFKRRYVDTGQVRFAIREFLTDPAAVAAAGFMLARCAPRGRAFQALDVLFDEQASIVLAPRPIEVYGRLAPRLGLSTAQVQACLRDRAALDALNRRVAANAAAGVNSTPTFVVGSTVLEGEQSIEQLAAVIDPLLNARASRPAGVTPRRAR